MLTYKAEKIEKKSLSLLEQIGSYKYVSRIFKLLLTYFHEFKENKKFLSLKNLWIPRFGICETCHELLINQKLFNTKDSIYLKVFIPNLNLPKRRYLP